MRDPYSPHVKIQLDQGVIAFFDNVAVEVF